MSYIIDMTMDIIVRELFIVKTGGGYNFNGWLIEKKWWWWWW